jgi:hypothetical protein
LRRLSEVKARELREFLIRACLGCWFTGWDHAVADSDHFSLKRLSDIGSIAWIRLLAKVHFAGACSLGPLPILLPLQLGIGKDFSISSSQPVVNFRFG